MRSPDEIMNLLDDGLQGLSDVDVKSLIWEIIEDVIDTATTLYATDVLEAMANQDGDSELPLHANLKAHCKASMEDMVGNAWGDL